MKKAKLVFVVLGVIIGLFLFNTSVRSNDSSKLGEVGIYSLFKINDEGKEVLYKINTKTGQVWCYSEYAVMNSDDLGVTGKEKEGLDKLIGDAKKQGKNVYTMPFWTLTSEERPNYYTIK